MIKIVSVLLVSVFSLFGSNILSYNIYDRTDRVDVMLTFDVPYDGKILKSEIDKKIVLKLYDTTIESTKIKHISSRFLTTLSINPMNGYTQIVATVPSNDITLKASKTTDAYGLRLRFLKKSALQTASQLKRQATQNAQNGEKIFPNLPTKQSSDISANYYIVVTILIIAIIVMLLIKKKMSNPPSSEQSNWLFKGATPKAPKMQPTKKAPQNDSDDVSIRFQKQLDERNSVIMIDFQEYSYLLLIGQSNNILLDRFRDNAPTSQEEFESLLREKSDKLTEFLQIGTNRQKENDGAKEDILKIFSQKASNTPYDQ